MCLLKKCCCGCSLRTGCWIIAILCLIIYTLSAIGSLYNAVHYHQNIDSYLFDGETDDMVTAKFWLDVVFSVAGLISAIFLTHGTKSSNVNSLWVFFYTQLVFIILSFIIFILLFVLGFHWIDALPYLIGPFFDIYMIIVVKSYIIELKNENSGYGGVALSDIEASNKRYPQ